MRHAVLSNRLLQHYKTCYFSADVHSVMDKVIVDNIQLFNVFPHKVRSETIRIKKNRRKPTQKFCEILDANLTILADNAISRIMKLKNCTTNNQLLLKLN